MRALGGSWRWCSGSSSSSHSWRRLLFVLLLAASLSGSTTTAIDGEDDGNNNDSGDNEIVVEAQPFILRMAPKPDEFSLQMKVTVLWTVENIVRQFFEEKYAGNQNTLFVGAGITGLSVVNEDDERFETIKFLGGAVAFHGSSNITPNQTEIQTSIRESLNETVVIDKLGIYFPSVTTVDYVPMVLGNRGFGWTEPEFEEAPEEPTEEVEKVPIPPKTPPANNANPDTETNPEADASSSSDDSNSINSFRPNQQLDASNSRKTTIGLSTGVALGGAIIILLIALLVESRRRSRMEEWRESNRDSIPGIVPDDSHPHKMGGKHPSSSSYGAPRYYIEDDNKNNTESQSTLRLPRIWGVSPSQQMTMESGTTPGSSDVSASNDEGDSVVEILTCTSMDRRSIQEVESFEHQKRLVDTLKKEMMASNAEVHPYMQDTHLDNTEPCALSPTDLSAAALEKTTPSRPVAWNTGQSDSSFSGDGSGYDSPTTTSPLRAVMASLRLSSSLRHPPPPSRSRRVRSPYEPDESGGVEL